MPIHRASRARALRRAPGFRDELVALHHEIFRRNQIRIRDAVEGDSRELDAYERRYARSFPSPRAILPFAELLDRFALADVIYLGDYHTLEQAQRSMLRILRQAVPARRELVLAVEFVEGRHQRWLDAFLSGALSEAEFLKKVHFRAHWPYGDFSALREICDFAREHKLRVVGIDLDARQGASLSRRDRYAADVIVEELAARPQAQVFCLIGELHLAPGHLPAVVRRRVGRPLRQLTLHQNPERVYRSLIAAGTEQEAEVVELTRWRLALNVVPPIVCQQSFLRWLDDDDVYREAFHMQEAFVEHVNIITSLLQLDIDPAHSAVQIETFRDLSFLDRLRASGLFDTAELKSLRQQILNSESCYIPRVRLVYLGTPSVNHSSEEAAHFLRHCVAGEARPEDLIDAFYDRAVNEALAFFCSKLVNDKRKTVHEAAFRRLLRDSQAVRLGAPPLDEPSNFDVERARRVLEHKRLERRASDVDPELIFGGPPRLVDAVSHALGYILGDKLYYAVVRGVLAKQVVRAVFCDPLAGPGAAITAYFALLHRVAGVRVPTRV